jgi:hypothetical protein
LKINTINRNQEVNQEERLFLPVLYTWHHALNGPEFTGRLLLQNEENQRQSTRIGDREHRNQTGYFHFNVKALIKESRPTLWACRRRVLNRDSIYDMVN